MSRLSGNLMAGNAKESAFVGYFICFLLLAGSLYAAVQLPFCASDLNLFDIYFSLSFEGMGIAVCLLVKTRRSPIYLFEPYFVIMLVYILVFYAAPYFQLPAGDNLKYGIDISDNAVFASFLVVIGFASFSFAYDVTTIKSHKETIFYGPLCGRAAQIVLVSAYLFWLAAYVLSLMNSMTKGYSLFYAITGGLMGGGVDGSGLINRDDGVGFVSYFRYSLVGCWMVIFIYGKNCVLKIILFLLTITMMLLDGTRAAALIPLLAPVVFYYVKQKKSPKLSSVLVFVLVLVAVFAVMQATRAGIRTGAGFDLSGKTLDNMMEPFLMEIEDYKVFYAILGVVPERHDFLYGTQMIGYSLIILIPRVLWPGKPDPQLYELIDSALGATAVRDGVAYPALGEYYVEFGVLGCVLCMFLLGFFCKRLNALRTVENGNTLALVTYALVYPALMQVVIRGYFPQNFTMLLMLLAPILCFWIIAKQIPNNITGSRR